MTVMDLDIFQKLRPGYVVDYLRGTNADNFFTVELKGRDHAVVAQMTEIPKLSLFEWIIRSGETRAPSIEWIRPGHQLRLATKSRKGFYRVLDIVNGSVIAADVRYINEENLGDWRLAAVIKVLPTSSPKGSRD